MKLPNKKVIIIVMIATLLAIAAVGLKDVAVKLFKGSISEHVIEIDKYESVLGENGKYKEHFYRYNDIFPDKIEEDWKVEEFCYSYFNLADPCYMGYLVLELDENAFVQESTRLKNLQSSENRYIYDTTGFHYDALAIYADDYYGYIYALADYDNSQIIYVELQFCNGIMDINYYETIEEKHLPIGFDVSVEYEFLNNMAIGLQSRDTINMDFATNGEFIFCYDEKNIRERCTEEELSIICDIFNGKSLYKDDLSCGFREEISIKINDEQTFCIACDSCTILYWQEAGKYFRLSEDEMKQIYKFFEQYGAKFPCV